MITNRGPVDLNDPLAGISVLMLLYLDVFINEHIEPRTRERLMDFVIRVFNQFDDTKHGSGMAFERMMARCTINTATNSLEMAKTLLKSNKTLPSKDLTNDAAELFFGACNQKNRNKVTITEETVIHSSRTYGIITKNGECQGNRYRNLYAVPGRYRHIKSDTIGRVINSTEFSTTSDIQFKLLLPTLVNRFLKHCVGVPTEESTLLRGYVSMPWLTIYVTLY